jgi:chemotaxis methyl-accepting protein methylase
MSEPALTALVSARTGMELSRGGVDRALGSYATRRERELGLTPNAFVTLLASERGGAELERLVNSITVGYTWFFRDPGQLAAIESLLGGELGRPGKVRLWIPGCSTGEDAYSLALIAEHVGREVEILATDVNTQSLEHARRGLYGAWSVREMDPRFSAALTRRGARSYELAPSLRGRVTFARHNLIERPPLPSDAATWDVVLCRNVLIYFERDVALRVLNMLARSLAPGGYLVLGASEVMCDVPEGLEACYVAGRLAFRRADPGATEARAKSGAQSSGTFARDWLLAPVTPAQPTRLVSVFPAAADALRDSVPPPPQPSATPPSDIERELSAGHRLIEAGDVAGARLRYLAALGHDATRADAHLYAGVARYLCGEIEPAFYNLRAALFLDETLWPAAFYLALCHENSGHPAEALQAYEHVLRIHDRQHATHATFASVFDAWREDLCAVARRRVEAANAVARRVG